jgi:hypothetical protein
METAFVTDIGNHHERVGSEKSCRDLHRNWDGRARQAGAAAMVGGLIFATCVFGLVIVGILIMTQAITFEQLFNAIGRLLLFIGLLLATAWIVRLLFCSYILPWLVSLKAISLRLAIGVLAIILAALLVRAAISRFQH